MAFVFISAGTQNYLLASLCFLLTIPIIFLDCQDSECFAYNFLSFFPPAVKFSSIQQIISIPAKGQVIWKHLVLPKRSMDGGQSIFQCP